MDILGVTYFNFVREPIKNFSPNKKQKFREIIAHNLLINVNFMPSSVCPVFGTDGLWNKHTWVDMHFLLSRCFHEFTSHFRNF